MEFTLTFLKLFIFGLYLATPLLGSLLLIIIALGQFVGRKESWTRFDALYWTFVTATTLGYGDFSPSQKSTKALTVIMTLTGLIFTGIIVALALNSATVAFKSHGGLDKVESGVHRITK